MKWSRAGRKIYIRARKLARIILRLDACSFLPTAQATRTLRNFLEGNNVMRNLVFGLATMIGLVTVWIVGAHAEDFVFGGHKHCWYDKGWNGAGWYWCGYADRKDKKGWGGPEGYQGWKH
jgi:hypothetical protein